MVTPPVSEKTSDHRKKMTVKLSAILLGLVTVAAISAVPASAATTAALWCNTRAEYTGHSALPMVPAARTSSGGITFACTMSRGAQGEAVRALQTSLYACYSQHQVDIDGVFGPVTEEALEYAQLHEKIGVDGIYGSETRDHIMHRSWRSFACSRIG